MRRTARSVLLLGLFAMMTALAGAGADPATANGAVFEAPAEPTPTEPQADTTQADPQIDLTTPEPSAGVGCPGSVNADLCNIDHIIVIMQENRSFDHYFGAYTNPNDYKVAGIPRQPGGKFKPCIPHPLLPGCQRPFRTTNPVNKGGPHAHTHSVMDVDGGKMDGFIQAALSSKSAGSYHCVADPYANDCQKFNGPSHQPDLLSVMDRRTIPNYWDYANRGVLQDHMFGPVDSWSLPAHLYMYSGWSAECPGGPMTCKSALETHNVGPYQWTDITYLLEQNSISWKNYVGEDTVISCAKRPCGNESDRNATPWIWNVLPNFQDVIDNDQVHRTQPVSSYFDDAKNGTLPQVSWVLPSLRNSEHPAHGSLIPGQNYVTRVVNAAANGPDWGTTAIFLSWDDWGGFYDHIEPPNIDRNGYGLRVPGLVIGPYVKDGWVDHQNLSFDAYLKFIEDRFLSGERLDPKTLGRPDSRPTVREDVDRLGDLIADFDFTQPPRPPEDFILDPVSHKAPVPAQNLGPIDLEADAGLKG